MTIKGKFKCGMACGIPCLTSEDERNITKVTNVKIDFMGNVVDAQLVPVGEPPYELGNGYTGSGLKLDTGYIIVPDGYHEMCVEGEWSSL